MRKETLFKPRPVYWIVPAVFFFLVFMLIPLLFAFTISFYRWDGFSRKIFENFIGFSNYLNLFRDRLFLISLKNTIILVFGVTVIQNIFAFFLAVFIFFGRFKRSDVIRTIIFFPGVISAVVIALVWRRILMSDGLINTILNLTGIESIQFLSNKSLVMWVITSISIWQWTGFNLVIMYAGLQSLNMDIH